MEREREAVFSLATMTLPRYIQLQLRVTAKQLQAVGMIFYHSDGAWLARTLMLLGWYCYCSLFLMIPNDSIPKENCSYIRSEYFFCKLKQINLQTTRSRSDGVTIYFHSNRLRRVLRLSRASSFLRPTTVRSQESGVGCAFSTLSRPPIPSFLQDSGRRREPDGNSCPRAKAMRRFFFSSLFLRILRLQYCSSCALNLEDS